jgi:ABC-2 type transport system permease protein
MKAVRSLYLAQAREFLRERTAVLFVLLLPVAFGVFFGLIFSGDNGFALQFGIANEDEGPVGAQLITALRSQNTTQGLNLWVGDRDNLLADMEKGNLHAVLILPAGLTEALTALQTVEVEVYYDSARPTSADLGQGVMRSLINEINLHLSGSTQRLEVRTQAVQTEPLRSIDFYLPGMLGIALLWLGVFGTAQPIVAQREQQILRRFSVTPLTRLSMLAAEVGWRVTVGLMQAAIFLIVGYFGFGVGIVSWLPFLATVLLGTLVFVSLGYALAGVGRSMESTMAIAQLVNFPVMMLSGSIFSAEMLPDFFQPLVNAMPLTYLSDLLRHTMVGAPLSYSMGLNFAVLGGWLVGLILLAIKLWRWE